jgi:HEAT repeat protein
MPIIRKPQPPGGAALDPDSFDGRWAAYRQMATDKNVSGLAAALRSESNARLQGAIFTSLAQIANPETVEALLPFFRSDDAGLRTGALDALRSMPDVVQPMLAALLTDSDGDVRLLACEIVRNLETREATRLLCILLQREIEANVAGAAVEVLSEVGDAEAIPVLAACAERFAGDSFLPFAIKIALERLRARRTP